jgi:dGTPase
MPMDWSTLLSPNRIGETASRPSEDGRSEFQKDYDRIVFSRAFRRLQGKTQVHPLPENDHVHTRLTHTLEVASVGRSLGARVGLHLDKVKRLPEGGHPHDLGSILQAACLAHDIGNPPFGHGGEFAIRAWFKQNHDYLKELTNPLEKLDLEGYEGNAQGLRILTQLEGDLFNGGLRLTFATLGTFMKYPWSSGHAASIGARKFGYFQTEKDVIEKIATELQLVPKGAGAWSRHPLAFLVEAADDICYSIIDLEDALEVGILDFNQVESIFSGALVEERHLSEYRAISNKDQPRQISYLRGKVVDFLVQQAYSAFVSREDAILNGDHASDLLDHGDERARDIIRESKGLASEKVFSAPAKTQIEIGAYAIIDTLLRAFCEAFVEYQRGTPSFKSQRVYDLLGVNAPEKGEKLYPALIRMADFVSSSTDKFAAQLSSRLNGIVFHV